MSSTRNHVVRELAVLEKSFIFYQALLRICVCNMYNNMSIIGSHDIEIIIPIIHISKKYISKMEFKWTCVSRYGLYYLDEFPKRTI